MTSSPLHSEVKSNPLVYLVGGAVRDSLLGLSVTERDWVVVGSSSDAMLAQGYLQVGQDFPVFLHPISKEEYALARLERKVEGGYKGFVCDVKNVTLEEDLIRRDLTINAMAVLSTDIDIDGFKFNVDKVIDPYGGQSDLKNKSLKHVSNAFTEDPVRVLRIARFLARFKSLGFSIAAQTNSLMQEMVSRGELDYLVPERVYQEWFKAFQTANPECFYSALLEAKAFGVVFPELEPYYDSLVSCIQIPLELDALPQENLFYYRFVYHLACLDEQDFKKTVKRLKIPSNVAELTLLLIKYKNAFTQLVTGQLSVSQQLILLLQVDGLRKPERYHEFLVLCQLDVSFQNKWMKKLEAIKAVDLSDIPNLQLKQKEVLALVEQRRLAALERLQ